MTPMMRSFFSALILTTALTGPVLAGPAEDAEAAYAADQKKDYATAMRLYQSAAAGGNAYAMYSIGLIYFEGKGVDRSYINAMKWYKQAAEKGYPQAQHAMGSMYEQGQGVKRDIAEAAKWYNLSANQGYLLSQNALGVIYTTGDTGVQQDLVKAHMWFNIASKEDATATSRRDRLKARMKPEQLAEAEKLANEFKPKK
jgi:TPR repeat protein